MRFRSTLSGLVGLLVVTSTIVQAQDQDINNFIDVWHHAAATADAEIFFNSMRDDCIYIGTDATERWNKTEFVAFAKPYFDKKKTWDFKPRNRDLHVTSDGQIVWFSELLDTWMGVCRGSGILVKTSNGWKFTQYHLSVTVPNEIIGDFIKLIDESGKQPQK